MTLRYRKTDFVIMTGIISAVFLFPVKSEAEDKAKYFFNDSLQKIVSQESFFVVSDEKIPVKLSDFVTTDSILMQKENYSSEIENPFYCPKTGNSLPLCDITQIIGNKTNYQKAGKLIINEEKLKVTLDGLAKNRKREPQDATFRFDKGKLEILSPSKNGFEIDAKTSLENIISQLSELQEQTIELKLAANEKLPNVSSGDIKNIKIEGLIGKGESNFKGSPVNRIHNIQVATKRFDGVMLKPGQEFSFTSILGEVDESTGYKEELVIKKNETIPEFGGGVCQVSTTMFRAALNAGLKITERRNHAYPVGYYAPQGTDATIYVPRPDFRFINNTPGYLLIQPSVVGTKMIIEMYGLSDKRQVELEGPIVTERTPDGKMRTVLYQRVKNANGELIIEDTFKSFYDNPANYKHPEPVLTEKPKDWSSSQWKTYKKEHNL